MNKKLKIAIFTDNFLPGVGGTENATLNIAKELIKKEHEVIVIAPKYKSPCETDLPFEVLRKKSIKIDSNDFYAIPFFNQKLFKTLDKFAPDIIHCQTQASMLSLALKYSKTRKIPCVATIHTKFSYAYKNATHSDFLTNIAIKRIGKKLKKADVVTAVSYSMKDEFAKYGYNGEFKVIKNGSCFSPVPDVKKNQLLAKKEYGIEDTDNILLFVGHISKIKNVQFIFETLDNLISVNKNFKMVFVGSGDGDEYFKKLANTKSYKDNVKFLGQITNRELLSSVYANAKLFLFPSIFDNDSLTIVESALNRVPSIVLEDTGVSERITNNKNGFIVPRDSQKMAEKIDYLLRNPQILQEIGQNASIELPKTWGEMVDKYIDLYQTTLSEHNLKNKNTNKNKR